MKKCFIAMAVGMMLIAVSLTGCGDEPKDPNAQLQAQLQQAQNQIQQLQQQAAVQAANTAQLAQQQVEQPQVVQQAPAQPVVVQAPAASHDNTLMNTMVGAAAGVAIGNMLTGAGGGYRQPVVQHHTTVIKKNVYQKPSYRPTFRPKKNSYTRSFTRSSSFRRR